MNIVEKAKEFYSKWIKIIAYVVVVLVIVFGFVYLFTNYREQIKLVKARDTVARLVKAIIEYKGINGDDPASLEELVPKFISKVPVDPWGHKYRIDTDWAVVFSCGPDGKPHTRDDIVKYYQKDLYLLKAIYDDRGTYAKKGDDLLILVFSKKIGEIPAKAKLEQVFDFFVNFKRSDKKYLVIDPSREVFLDADSEDTLVIPLAAQHSISVGQLQINVKEGQKFLRARDLKYAVPSGAPISIEAGAYNKFDNLMRAKQMDFSTEENVENESE